MTNLALHVSQILSPVAVASALGAEYGRDAEGGESIWLPRHLWGRPQVLRAVQRVLGTDWHWFHGATDARAVIVRKEA